MAPRSSPEVVPSCQQIYSHRNEQDACVTAYFPGLNVHWSEDYKWNVYLGDIVAVSTEDLKSVHTLDDWRPNHIVDNNKNNKNQSSRWKIGLVLALTQTTYSKKSKSSSGKKTFNNKKQPQQCFQVTVQWLDKANDREDFKKHLVKSNNFRKFAKSKPFSQIPHMLLNTKETEAVDIIRLLPVRITMLTKADFQVGIRHAEEDGWDLRFFCCKELRTTTTNNNNNNDNTTTTNTTTTVIGNDNEPDEWAHLNPMFADTSTSKQHKIIVPKPLRKAWTAWHTVREEIPELLQNLIRGFQEATKKKFYQEKNRCWRLQQEAEAEENQEEEPPTKKTRIVEPKDDDDDETNARTAKQPTPSKSKKPLASAMKTSSTKAATVAATKTKTARGSDKKKSAVTTNKKKTLNASAKKSTKNTRTAAEDDDNTPIVSSDQSESLRENNEDDGGLQITPRSEVIHEFRRGKVTREFYDRVEVTIEPDVYLRKPRNLPGTFSMTVGDVVAIRLDESNGRPPFCVSWSIAQVLAIFKKTTEASKTNLQEESWNLQVRWFFRYDEMDSSLKIKTRTRPGFDREHSILETDAIDDCPLKAALAAVIRFVGEDECFAKSKSAPNHLPLIQVRCKHHWDTNCGKIQVVDGWSTYGKRNNDDDGLPAELTRGLDLLKSSGLAKKYREAIAKRTNDLNDTIEEDDDDDDGGLSVEAERTAVARNNKRKGRPTEDTRSASKKKRKNTTSAALKLMPRSNVILKKRGPRNCRTYYRSVQLDVNKGFFDADFKSNFKISSKSFDIAVGDILAVIREDEENDSSPAVVPFCRGWDVAQVLSIYETARNGWKLEIRRMLRYGDLSAEQRENAKGLGFSISLGLLEVMPRKPEEISLDEALPAVVQISNDGSGLTGKPSIKDGLPLIQFECCHLEDDEGSSMRAISDWENYFELSPLFSVPGPLERGFACLAKGVAKQYRNAIENGEKDSELSDAPDESNAMDLDERREEVDVSLLQAVPLSSKPVYTHWGRKFYDGIRMDVDQKYMLDIIPRTRHWTVKVGYVVAIRLDQPPLEDSKDETKCWYPYVTGWSPAQIVSIYQMEDSGEWMLQIRWFNRYRDLGELQRENIDVLDKPHAVFETEDYNHVSIASALPGRVVLASNELTSWDIKTSILTGLPMIPRFCSHICLDEDIENVDDWTGYDLEITSIPAPLRRGLLLSPRNREFKDWVLMLSRYYKKFIRLRGIDPDEEAFRAWSRQDRPTIPNRRTIELEASDVSISVGRMLLSNKAQGEAMPPVFHGSLEVTLPLKFIASPSQALKRTRKSCLGCALGDVVCYYDPNAKPRADRVLVNNTNQPWSPFMMPWSYGQILSIHSNANGETNLEIRRFYRSPELPGEIHDILPAAVGDEEEVFESDAIVDGIPAYHVLGKTSIFMANHKLPSTDTTENSKLSIQIPCRCRFFFLSSIKRIQPLFCSGLSPKIWFNALKKRGYDLSEKMKESEALRKEVEAFGSDRRVWDTSGLIPDAIFKLEPLSDSSPHDTDIPIKRFKSAEISPNWALFSKSNLLYNTKDRKKRWKVQVGDLVAVKDPSHLQNECGYPYLTPWIPCRIRAIYTDGDKRNESCISEGSLSFTLDVLRVSTEAHSKCEFAQLAADPVPPRLEAKAADLLGPLIAIARKDGNSDLEWGAVQKHLPFAPVFVDYTPMKGNLAKAANLQIQQNVSVQSDSVDQMETRENCNTRHLAGTTIAPFHVDYSQSRAYYSQFTMQTSLQDKVACTGLVKKIDPWSIRMGDMVVVHCEGAKRFPLNCNWGVAEIVAIWKRFSRRDELEKEFHSAGVIGGDVSLEVRWFYDRCEIAGFHQASAVEETDELFETDHLDVIDAATSVLARASIASDPESLEERSSCVDHTAIPHFFCKRFWSTTRKSLIPCGSQAGRQKRAWLHSKHLTSEMQQKIANLKRPLSIDSKNPTRKNPTRRNEKSEWHKSFERVIRKMTLKEASKGAYERGESLVGREKELEELLSFFRSAIRGEAGPGGVKSSIFLAGPPGVGKTACIRATIARLHSEQSRGELPKFDFISLNGMEMRHPFEAYVRLWEGLTGRKHVGPAEKACDRLENYFTGPESAPTSSVKTISVVLLDEIDYLITSKQTVLYNFFDWPKRAAEMSGPRRLVVVGISNTLNLAEQLLPSVQSRIGNERCIFKAYNLKDVVSILTAKLKEASPSTSVFEDDAILFAAKKTAALSGDIRRAFQICRAAAELVMSEQDTNDADRKPNDELYRRVKISDVQKASRESFNTALVTAVSFLTPFQALLLVSLASLCRTTGREVGGFDIKDIMTKMEALAGASGEHLYLPPPSFGETISLLNDLGEYNLVTLNTVKSTSTSFRATSGGSGGAWPIAALAIDEGTVIRGLKNTPYKVLAEKNLPPQF